MKKIILAALLFCSCKIEEKLSIVVTQEKNDPLNVWESGNQILITAGIFSDSTVVATSKGEFVFQKKGCPDRVITKPEAIEKLKAMKHDYFTRYCTRNL